MADLKILNPRQLAGKLGVSLHWIERMLRNGELPEPFRFKGKKPIRYWREIDIEAWLDEKCGKS